MVRNFYNDHKGYTTKTGRIGITDQSAGTWADGQMRNTLQQRMQNLVHHSRLLIGYRCAHRSPILARTNSSEAACAHKLQARDPLPEAGPAHSLSRCPSLLARPAELVDKLTWILVVALSVEQANSLVAQAESRSRWQHVRGYLIVIIDRPCLRKTGEHLREHPVVGIDRHASEWTGRTFFCEKQASTCLGGKGCKANLARTNLTSRGDRVNLYVHCM